MTTTTKRSIADVADQIRTNTAKMRSEAVAGYRELTYAVADGQAPGGALEVLAAAGKSVDDLENDAAQRNTNLRCVAEAGRLVAEADAMNPALAEKLEQQRPWLEVIIKARAARAPLWKLADEARKAGEGDYKQRCQIDELSRDLDVAETELARVRFEANELERLQKLLFKEADKAFAEIVPIAGELLADYARPVAAPLVFKGKRLPVIVREYCPPAPDGFPPLESIFQLVREGVGRAQICKIYGLVDADGRPMLWAIDQELDAPGSVIGPSSKWREGWRDPRPGQQIKDNAPAAAERVRQQKLAAAAESRRQAQEELDNRPPPETLEELVQQCVPADQIARMLKIPIGEVYAAQNVEAQRQKEAEKLAAAQRVQRLARGQLSTEVNGAGASPAAKSKDAQSKIDKSDPCWPASVPDHYADDYEGEGGIDPAGFIPDPTATEIEKVFGKANASIESALASEGDEAGNADDESDEDAAE